MEKGLFCSCEPVRWLPFGNSPAKVGRRNAPKGQRQPSPVGYRLEIEGSRFWSEEVGMPRSESRVDFGFPPTFVKGHPHEKESLSVGFDQVR